MCKKVNVDRKKTPLCTYITNCAQHPTESKNIYSEKLID